LKRKDALEKQPREVKEKTRNQLMRIRQESTDKFGKSDVYL